MGFDLDLSFSEQDNQALEAGTVRQPGWYRAVVQDITEEAEKGYWEFIYQVTDGAWTGSVIKDKVWKPESAADTEKAEMSLKRIKLILKRLGVWDGNAVSKKFSLADCIGRECWLKMSERFYQDKKTSSMVKTTDVEWAGVYGIDHEKVPVEVRNPGSAPNTSARASSARKSATSAPAAPVKKPDYSDL